MYNNVHNFKYRIFSYNKIVMDQFPVSFIQ